MKSYPHILARITGAPLLMEPGYSSVFFSALSSHMGLGELNFDGVKMGPAEMAKSVLSHQTNGSRPYGIQNGVAIIPIEGTLAHRTGNLSPQSGMTGYDGLKAQLQMAAADPDVKGVLLDVNSPGGEASGISEAADAVKNFPKPVKAHTGQMAASAAYWLASAASDGVVADETAMVGSIGAVMAHTDATGKMEKDGIKVELIRFGKRKMEGNPVEPLTDEARSSMQSSIDEMGMLFTSAVAKNRGLSLDAVLGTEAAMFTASKALEIGLIDEVASFDETLAKFSNSLANAEQTKQEAAMASEQEIGQARLEGAAAERARIGEILAIGHPGANHLAFNTNMSATEASALLAAIPAAPVVQAPAPVAMASAPAAALAALSDHQTVAQDAPRVFTGAEMVKPEAIMQNGNFSIAKAAAVLAQAKGAAK